MTAKKASRPAARSGGFTAEERDAMQERARELKTEARTQQDRAAGERELLARIAGMPGSDRALATRIHAIVSANAPGLAPKTWYGMPAWAREGKVLCFFQAASKFKARYASFGFNDVARLDEGAMWPVAFALVELTPAAEARIAELVSKAAR